MPDKSSGKYREARETLPEELKPVFDLLVEDYYFYSTVKYGRGYVAYKVLAELVRHGWRLEAEAVKEAVPK